MAKNINEMPFSITAESKGGKAEIRILGTIGWDTDAERFRSQVDSLVAQGLQEAHLYINSPGGSCFDAAEISNILAAAFGGRVTGEGGALVASAATYLALCCKSFSMPKNGFFMIHKPSGVAYGTVEKMESQLSLLREIDAQYLDAYKSRATDAAELEKQWASGDWWLSAQKAMDNGFVTSVRESIPIDNQTKAMMMACATGNEEIEKLLMMNQNQTEPKPAGTPAAQPATQAVTEPAVIAEATEKEPSWVGKLLAAIMGKSVGNGTAEATPTPEPAPEPAMNLAVSPQANTYMPQITKQKKQMKTESLAKWRKSDEGQHKMRAIAALANEVLSNPAAQRYPDNADAVMAMREFGHVLKNDPVAMELLKHTSVSVGDGRAELIPDYADRISASAGEATESFIEGGGDLALASVLNIFLQQLYPENSWQARTMKASGMDKAGMLYVQGAIDPDIYFGRRAPLDAPNYMYDDTPRGLITKVLAFQPILFQPSENDILFYDKQSRGLSEVMRKMSEAFAQYTLQVAAEEAGESVPMTGTAFDATGWFPALNPAASGNITSLGVQDIALLTAKFINENFPVEQYKGEIVLDARFMAEFKTIQQLLDANYKNAGTLDPSTLQFDAWFLRSRSRVAGWDTAASAVIDPQWYFDRKVNNDGSLAAAAAPVIPATTYGCGLAFMPNQIIQAMGNSHIHMVADPNNYGWKVSGDFRFGAGVLREGGAGVKLLVPTVA